MSAIENLIESYRQDDSTISNENVGYLAKDIEALIAQQLEEAYKRGYTARGIEELTK